MMLFVSPIPGPPDAMVAHHHPAIVLLFMVTSSGESAQEWFAKVGEHYGLPMVSLFYQIRDLHLRPVPLSSIGKAEPLS